jgi:hypothetical protein
MMPPHDRLSRAAMSISCPHCGGSIAPAPIPLLRADTALAALPYGSIDSLRKAAQRGRVDWLTRTGPDGRRTRHLWIAVARCREWLAARGHAAGVRALDRLAGLTHQ